MADLKGKKLGVAGGPLDKGWLMLQAYAKRSAGMDLAAEVEPVYGAPPLLTEKLKSGELDAVLNYWHFGARLEADGYRRLIGIGEVQEALGVPASVPQLGYVFKEGWADEHADLVEAFARASRAAKEIMKTSDEEWQRLMPVTRAEDEAELDAFMRRYREGIVEHWGEQQQADAAEALPRPGRARRREAGGHGDRAGPGHVLAQGELLSGRGAQPRLGAAPPPRPAPCGAPGRWRGVLVPGLSLLLLLALWQLAASLAATRA